MKKIALIIAMKEELENFGSILGKGENLNTRGYDIDKVFYNGLEILITVSGIGKAAASSAATALLERYNDIELVLNIGTAGGLGPLKIGGIVISNSVGYGDVDVSAFGYEVGQLPKQPKIFSSKIGEEIVLEAIKNNPNLNEGLVITLDSFIANKEKAQSIKKLYENSLVIDMELAAIAQICTKYNTPFVSIKIISDNANNEASTDFKDNLTREIPKISNILPQILSYIHNK